MTEAVQRGFLTGDMVEFQRLLHDDHYFVIQVLLFRFLRISMKRKDVPPYIAHAIEGAAALFIDTGNHSRTSLGEKVSEKSQNGPNGTLSFRPRNRSVFKGENIIGARRADQVVQSLRDLRVGKSTKRRFRAFESLSHIR
ncbi:MAG: hypothetical protein COV48_07470 [Elusimicrobia bacterium CG11_big_fil_rev_8_21_14_0_20_64_6]|nr:MAG: hypothetical protein COV48_07470 [Elusimicrobia bacterium CG11_big_fil_rev_8_21_14_0_20_64_6]